jgi:CheY-like chemotaxis protein
MRTRILVLDDQKYLREMIAEILDNAGYPAEGLF